MNKDVIYIEPEDDITDIISKIENSKEKIVALVPPKKAGVFRSVVNIKLIAKAGVASAKNVVIVTTDPSIMKLAGATKIPVTKDLQSAPTIPAAEEEVTAVAKEELVEEPDGEVKTEEEPEGESEEEPATDEKEEEDTEEKAEEEKEEKEAKPEKKKPKSNNKIVAWFNDHRKLAIFGGVGILVLILLLIWAFVIAPAVTVTVTIKTDSNNFSENVNFTIKLTEEKAEEGTFYIEEKKVESTSEVEFKATGQKNVGEKASGDVVIYTYFKDSSITPINAGSKFTISGLTFVSTKDVSLSWDGKTISSCENKDEATLIFSGCLISGRVDVVAAAPGESYNIAASSTGWNTAANVSVYSDRAMSGGSDKMITVVQQSDIDKAKSELADVNEGENKEKLYDSIDENSLAIDSSFLQTTSDAVSTPAVGEEVKDDEKPVLKATTTTSVFVIDKVKVEEFITAKAKLGDAQKIYEIENPFIEHFMQSGDGYTGKLKAVYATGPKITENEVMEMIRGKGLGDAQRDLRDIDGIANVRMDKSFPWVMAVPNNSNKITVVFERNDQKDKEESKTDNDESKTDNNNEEKNR